MQLLSALAPFAPLTQTLAWITLIVALLVWFRRPIDNILESIQRRVEAGNAIRVGPLEMPELRPMSPEQQRKKTTEELEDVRASVALAPSPNAVDANMVANYLQAEDLALRAVQAEFDTPVMRQVQGPNGALFDAAFVKHGRLHVVEVKVYDQSVDLERLRASVAKLASVTVQMSGDQARLLVVTVYGGRDNASDVKARIRETLSRLALAVDVRVYTRSALQEQFGARES